MMNAVATRVSCQVEDRIVSRRKPLRLGVYLLVVVVALLLVLDSYGTSTADLGGPYFDLDGLDGAEGHAWLDSSVRVTADKPLSLKEVAATFSIQPSPANCSHCLSVAREGLTPWDGWAPWAHTTITFNPDRLNIFRPETEYTVSVLGKRFQFRTIAVPEAVRFSPSPGQGRVKTTVPIEIEFDRLLAENPRYLVTLEPAAPFTPRWEGRKLIVEHQRLWNDETYKVILWPGIRDWAGHPSQETFSFTFTTVAAPAVVSAQPGDDRLQSVFAEVRVGFDQPMDRAAVEQSFRVEPAASGSFQWPDDRTLVWKPLVLFYSTTYRISVGGRSQEGDPLSGEFSWQFRTQDPPRSPITASEDGSVVLTFDDQGSKAQVEAILDILAQNHVGAVFFPVGKWAKLNPELIDRMKAEGHLIGNHTYSHAHLTGLTDDEIRWEIENGAGGFLFRPPYREGNGTVDRIAGELGYQIYLWNVDSRDWTGAAANVIVETVMREVKPGAVIVMHLHGAHTAEALKQLIPLLTQAGYKFSLPKKPSP